jgi:hypothetical protein
MHNETFANDNFTVARIVEHDYETLLNIWESENVINFPWFGQQDHIDYYFGRLN